MDSNINSDKAQL